MPIKVPKENLPDFDDPHVQQMNQVNWRVVNDENIQAMMYYGNHDGDVLWANRDEGFLPPGTHLSSTQQKLVDKRNTYLTTFQEEVAPVEKEEPKKEIKPEETKPAEETKPVKPPITEKHTQTHRSVSDVTRGTEVNVNGTWKKVQEYKTFGKITTLTFEDGTQNPTTTASMPCR